MCGKTILRFSSVIFSFKKQKHFTPLNLHRYCMTLTINEQVCDIPNDTIQWLLTSILYGICLGGSPCFTFDSVHIRSRYFFKFWPNGNFLSVYSQQFNRNDYLQLQLDEQLGIVSTASQKYKNDSIKKPRNILIPWLRTVIACLITSDSSI